MSIERNGTRRPREGAAAAKPTRLISKRVISDRIFSTKSESDRSTPPKAKRGPAFVSDDSADELAAQLLISPQAIEEAMRRRLLSFVKHRNSCYWRFGDRANGTTRALNGNKFVRSDNKGPDWHKLIGLADVVEHDRRFVILVLEGSTDALAAFELAHRAGLLCQVGIVMALGAGYRPITTELRQLSGRKVLLVGDRDQAGMAAVRRVSFALTQANVGHAVWNWNAFNPNVGKDLFDLVKADSQQEKTFDPNYLTFFSFFSPSYSSTVQQFNSSTVQQFNSRWCCYSESGVQQFNSHSAVG